MERFRVERLEGIEPYGLIPWIKVENMKLDKRKKYIMVLDVETTNNDMTSKFNDGLVYDIGFGIYDLKGKAYCERSYCIKEIFEDKSLMNSAYYREKLPIYYKELEQGKR